MSADTQHPVEIVDVIAFKEDGAIKHMVVFKGADGEHATQAYGKCERYDRGSLTQCHDEIVTRYGIEAGDNSTNRWLQGQIVGQHFLNMHRGVNRAGQDYPMETAPLN